MKPVLRPRSLFSLALLGLWTLLALGAGVSAQRSAVDGVAPDAAWSAAARREIGRLEYAFRPLEASDAAGWSAPNRAQALRTTVGPAGFRVEPARAPTWALELTTLAFGREDALVELEGGRIQVQENRLERAFGPLTEWLVNEARGLEHGWTIHSRPPGDPDARLCLRLGLGGGLVARLDTDGLGLDLCDAQGLVRARYAGLVAHDRDGRALEARLASTAGGLVVRVHARGAAYPLTIDPVVTSGAWSAEGPGAGTGFGWAVAGAGDVNGDGFSDLIVGAPFFEGLHVGEGAAFVFLGSPGGPSTSPDWSALGGGAQRFFGAGVATAGDVDGDGYSDVIVGAPLYEDGEAAEGRVLVYRGSASGLEATPAWSFESNQAGVELGGVVACAGDVNGDGFSDVLVGSPLFTGTELEEGAAYLFLGSASGPASAPDWTVTGGGELFALGWSVASGGDLNADGFDDVLIGVPGFSDGEADEGAVQGYLGSALGLATTPSWSVEGNVAGIALGTAVAAAGDVDGDGFDDVLAGAPGYSNGQASEGAALLFAGGPGGPATTPAWQVEGEQGGLALGEVLSGAGDLDADGFDDVALGLPAFSNGQSDEGAVRVHLGSATGLSSAADFVLESDEAFSEYASSLAAAGDVDGDGYSDVVVGTPEHEGTLGIQGLAALLAGGPGLPSRSGDVVFDGAGTNSGLGLGLRAAGDVNGDGFDDVVAGAYQYDGPTSNLGHAWLFLGSATGLVPVPAWDTAGTQSTGWYGYAVSGLGDIDGDGYADVAVGAPRESDGQSTEGTVHVFRGSPSGFSTSADARIEIDVFGAQLGVSVDGGDFNGDGYADLVAGAFTYSDGQSQEGGAFVFLGSPAGLATSPSWSWSSDQADARAGFCVASAGDVNGDGISDLLVAADHWDGGELDEGRALLFLGTPSGPEATPSWSFETDQASAGLSHVACAGDVNGDGFSDVLVGALFYDGAAVDSGAAWVFLGSASGLATTPAWTDLGLAGSSYYAYRGGNAGDVDGDGYDDLAIAHLWYRNVEFREGAAWLYRGGAAGPSPTADWQYESNQTFAAMGQEAIGAGDVDGDGTADLLVGGSFDSSPTDSGRILCFRGNDGGGATRTPEQLRADGSAPIVPLGLSDAPNAFRIRMRFDPAALTSAWSAPFPRAFLEWEVKPLGSAFDGQDLGRSPVGQAIVPGGPALVFEEPVTGLAAQQAYRWRARIVTTDPLHPATPWFGPAGRRAANELHLRTPAGLPPADGFTSATKAGLRGSATVSDP